MLGARLTFLAGQAQAAAVVAAEAATGQAAGALRMQMADALFS